MMSSWKTDNIIDNFRVILPPILRENKNKMADAAVGSGWIS